MLRLPLDSLASAINAASDILVAASDVRAIRRKPSWPFAHLAQRLGLHAIGHGHLRIGVEHLRAPVASVRHFELPYAYSALPSDDEGRWLDISSPRLLPLYLATHRDILVEAWNPDPTDAEATRTLARTVRASIVVRELDFSALPDMHEEYRCITSLSVVEHIDGEYDDRQAVTWMANALAPGGTLVVTVPVAKTYREEYRSHPVYPTQPRIPGRGYFFQRWYDEEALQKRLFAGLGDLHIRDITFTGEVQPGLYENYQRKLRENYVRARTKDASWFYQAFAEFERWKDLPGMGVCGIVVTK